MRYREFRNLKPGDLIKNTTDINMVTCYAPQIDCLSGDLWIFTGLRRERLTYGSKLVVISLIHMSGRKLRTLESSILTRFEVV